MTLQRTVFQAAKLSAFLSNSKVQISFGLLLSTVAIAHFSSEVKAASLTTTTEVPKYDRIFVIVMENLAFGQILGNPNAPNMNQYAQTYGLATNNHGITHPSEPNYVAMIGGDYFGIQDDNSFLINTLNKPSLATQLEEKGLTWKSYSQSLPSPGFLGEVYPDATNKLYASKHNPFLNFEPIRNNPDPNYLKNVIVDDQQLFADLSSGKVPNFSFIVPDQCHDIHGTDSCPKGTSIDDPKTKALINTGDSYVGKLVSSITESGIWSQGNNAIIITFDEDDKTDNNRIPTIVIGNNGPRGIQDDTYYTHYSMLKTVQQAFGLGCLENTCKPETNVMSPLFATTDAAAVPEPATMAGLALGGLGILGGRKLRKRA